VSFRSARPAARQISLPPIASRSTTSVIGIAALVAVGIASRGVPQITNEGPPPPYLSKGNLARDFSDETARCEFSLEGERRPVVAFDATLRAAKGYLQTGLPTIVPIGTDKHVEYFGRGEASAATLDSQMRCVL
jgi:hypothetical protein